jgi:hypothetical protein
MRLIFLVSVMYCQILVSPGTGAVLHTFFPRSVLITQLLPTFGYPCIHHSTRARCELMRAAQSRGGCRRVADHPQSSDDARNQTLRTNINPQSPTRRLLWEWEQRKW